MDRQLLSDVRDAVLAAPDEYARATLLYELTRTVYDTVKMTYADRGRADTPERSGVGTVTDAANDHRGGMAAAHQRPVTVTNADADAGDLVHLSLADPSEAFQRQITEPLTADDTAVQLTVYQAEKCAAIIHAYLDGQTLFGDAVRDVAFLLTARAIQASGIPHRVADPWPRIAPLPWPPPPGLRTTPND